MGWLALLLLWGWTQSDKGESDLSEGGQPKETPEQRAAQIVDSWDSPGATMTARSDLDARAAARDLANFYAVATQAVRAGKAKAEAVKPLQRRMGVAADGYIGPATRARAAELGVVLWSRDANGNG